MPALPASRGTKSRTSRVAVSWSRRVTRQSRGRSGRAPYRRGVARQIRYDAWRPPRADLDLTRVRPRLPVHRARRLVAGSRPAPAPGSRSPPRRATLAAWHALARWQAGRRATARSQPRRRPRGRHRRVAPARSAPDGYRLRVTGIRRDPGGSPRSSRSAPWPAAGPVRSTTPSPPAPRHATDPRRATPLPDDARRGRRPRVVLADVGGDGPGACRHAPADRRRPCAARARCTTRRTTAPGTGLSTRPGRPLARGPRLRHPAARPPRR